MKAQKTAFEKPLRKNKLVQNLVSKYTKPAGKLQIQNPMERAMGFEPTTPTLARLCSTPELHPLTDSIYILPVWRRL